MPLRGKIFGLAGRNWISPRRIARAFRTCHRINRERREPGQHSGPITPAYLQVLYAIFNFGRSTGFCFPSYDAIADQAGVARATVARAIRVLEAHGILTWTQRLTRAGDRVLRASNQYLLTVEDPDEKAKSQFQPGPAAQRSYSESATLRAAEKIAEPRLVEALARLGAAIRGSPPPQPAT